MNGWEWCVPREFQGTHRLRQTALNSQRGSLIPLQGESSMTDLQCDGVPTPMSLERSKATVRSISCGILCSQCGEPSDSSTESIEEFIGDRFSTKLEDPCTGRRIR